MLETLYCTFEDCVRVADIPNRELCRKHYSHLHRKGLLPDLGPCISQNCERRSIFRGLCIKHRGVSYPQYFTPHMPAHKGKNIDTGGNKLPCSSVGCNLDASCRGLCRTHYYRWQNPVAYKSPNKGPAGDALTCSASEGCSQEATSKGLCYKHWERVNKRGVDTLDYLKDVCPVESCGREKLSRKDVCSRCSQLAKRYSISITALQEMHLSRNRVCGNPGCSNDTRLHVDHSHDCCPSGKFGSKHVVSCGACVRGWLCASCNKSLGMLQENPRRIQGLLEYLDLHRG